MSLWLEGGGVYLRRMFLSFNAGALISLPFGMSLSKKRWLAICGFPLNLWTLEIFEAIGQVCGSLLSIDCQTLSCNEL